MLSAKNEVQDVRLLGAAIAIVCGVWTLLLGASIGGASIAAHDGLAHTLPYLKQWAAYGGDWTRFQYLPAISGGVKAHDVYGMLPIFQWLGVLGAGPLFMANAVLLLFQVFYAFLGTRAALDLSGARAGRLEIGASLALHAFTPVLGWKLAYGHHILLLGLGPSIVALGAIAAVQAGRLTITHSAVALVALLHSFPHAGQQSVLYSAVFGLPIFVGCLCRPSRAEIPRWGWAIALVLAGVGLSLPKMAGLFAHVASSDAGRSLGGPPVIYSYVTATAWDWLTSIPWGMSIIDAGRDFNLMHEINCPIGPLPLALGLLAWRESRGWIFGLAVSIAFAIWLSMDAKPVSDAMLAVIPPLKGFRVPERAILPALLALPTLASAAWFRSVQPSPSLKRPDAKAGLVGIGALALFAALSYFPASLREVTAWSVLLAALAPRWMPGLLPNASLLRRAALVAIAGLSLGAFRERILPYFPRAQLVDGPAYVGGRIIQENPSLASPLERVHPRVVGGVFNVNEVSMLGLSSMNGYWSPPLRMIELIAALEGQPVQVLSVRYQFMEQMPIFSVMRPLYNVRWAFAPAPQGSRGSPVQLEPLGETAGPAWFAAQGVAHAPDLYALAQKLRELAGASAIPAEAHRAQWVVDADAAVKSAALPAALDCASAQVEAVQAKAGDPEIRVALKAGTTACPLTLAMNYVTSLRARSVDVQGKEADVAVYPAFGALAGVMVPVGAREIRFAAVPTIPLWSRLGFFAGLAFVALAIAVVFWDMKTRVTESPISPKTAAR